MNDNYCVHGAPMTPGTLHGDHCEPMSAYTVWGTRA
jgi:hypothetical protein